MQVVGGQTPFRLLSSEALNYWFYLPLGTFWRHLRIPQSGQRRVRIHSTLYTRRRFLNHQGSNLESRISLGQVQKPEHLDKSKLARERQAARALSSS